MNKSGIIDDTTRWTRTSLKFYFFESNIKIKFITSLEGKFTK